MDFESRATTLETYFKSADSLAEYYDSKGPRIEDIERAISLWGGSLPVVVEIGCGSGRDAQEIVKRTPYYVGFDISRAMVEKTREKLFGGVVLQADLRYAFESDASSANGEVIPDDVDIIFAFASLLHSDEEELTGVLKDAAQKLTPGGIFYISLKSGNGKFTQEDEFGTRTFHLYQPDQIKQMAGISYETVFEDEHAMDHKEWFTIALKKVS